MTRGIVALDGDGVLLDYHAAYPLAWQRVFGTFPRLRDKDAYWPHDRWDVPRLEGDQLANFRAAFDDAFWSTIPPIPGALKACKQLTEAGYELVCVTALAPEFQNARRLNLESSGFPIQRVITTSSQVLDGISPKAGVIKELGAVAFVDDYLPYHQGIHIETHLALVTREPNGSPNTGDGLRVVNSTHEDLAAFAVSWLSRI